jgi:hypothetical protein
VFVLQCDYKRTEVTSSSFRSEICLVMSLTRASDAARFASAFTDIRLVAERTYTHTHTHITSC